MTVAEGAAEPVLDGVEIGVSPTGGHGLLARRSFQAGDLLYRDAPLAWLEAEAFDKRDASLLVSALGRLHDRGQLGSLLRGPAGRELWRGCAAGDWRREAHRRCLNDTWPEGSDLERAERAEALTVFSYNAFITDEDGGQLQVVYPFISKANHSCSSSCSVTAPGEDPGLLMSSRPIACGEELTVSYLSDTDLLRPRHWRRDRLRDGWEFDCVCARCQSEVEEARQFSCAMEACPGFCIALAVEVDEELVARPCSECGKPAADATLRAWAEQEKQIGEFLEDLPDSLFKAWNACEEFAAAHPVHGHSGRWKKRLALYLEKELLEAEPEEVEELEAEILGHRAALKRCLDVVLHRSDLVLPATAA